MDQRRHRSASPTDSLSYGEESDSEDDARRKKPKPAAKKTQQKQSTGKKKSGSALKDRRGPGNLKNSTMYQSKHKRMRQNSQSPREVRKN